MDLDFLKYSADLEDHYPILIQRSVGGYESEIGKIRKETRSELVPKFGTEKYDTFTAHPIADIIAPVKEEEIDKSKVAYHIHDGFSEHPVAVKYHQEYFSGEELEDFDPSKYPENKVDHKIPLDSVEHYALQNKYPLEFQQKLEDLTKKASDLFKIHIPTPTFVYEVETTVASTGFTFNKREGKKYGPIVFVAFGLDPEDRIKTLLHEFAHHVQNTILKGAYEDDEDENTGGHGALWRTIVRRLYDNYRVKYALKELRMY